MKQTKKVDLSKEVFDKSQYVQVIDTAFSQLGVASISASAEEQVSLEEFFGLYNDLFYDIPSYGETNSHEFLVKSSGEYINFDQIAEEILALQQEISSLREELLAEQIRTAELETGLKFPTGSLPTSTDTSNISTSISSGGSIDNTGATF
jgi:hypothetical protein